MIEVWDEDALVEMAEDRASMNSSFNYALTRQFRGDNASSEALDNRGMTLGFPRDRDDRASWVENDESYRSRLLDHMKKPAFT